MDTRHPLAELFHVSRTVLPQCLLDTGHAATPELLTGLVKQVARLHDLFNLLSGVALGRLRQVKIDHRGLQAAVAQQLLDCFQADARFQAVSGVAVAQRIHTLPANLVRRRLFIVSTPFVITM